MTPLLAVESLSISVGPRRTRQLAVADLSLEVGAAEIVGLVGESGAGKSLTALAVAGLLPPGTRITGGRILFEGSDLLAAGSGGPRRLLGRRVGMVFQEPGSALNPALTIGYQIAEPLRIHRGFDRRAARQESLRLLERVAVGGGAERLADYPHQLSGGQRQRVMIAIALACGPDLLLADEPTTALDVTVQAGILELLEDLRDELGLAVLFISHDLAVVAQLCDRIAVLYAGRVAEAGPTREVVERPAHPYTRALVGAVPGLGAARLAGVPGQMPEPGSTDGGCDFRPRCAEAFEPCDGGVPPLEPIGAGHRARCYLHGPEGSGRGSGA